MFAVQITCNFHFYDRENISATVCDDRKNKKYDEALTILKTMLINMFQFCPRIFAREMKDLLALSRQVWATAQRHGGNSAIIKPKYLHIYRWD